ncbi:hypothetical protein ACJDU8_24545 [Clostridium sp. WILCCON 0269]|uniref:Uncharacterized protein n=1 Tax=Candidatus Clostridium eludens TaxID=3381663 RepID=A0ABW8SUM7_9CLOT
MTNIEDILQEELNINIHLNREFNTVFDLSYLLVDLQSVINTIHYIEEGQNVICFPSESYEISEGHIYNNYETVEGLNLILKRLDEKNLNIDRSLRNELFEDLYNLISEHDFNISNRRTRKTHRRKTYIASTSRNFASKYKYTLRLKDFKKGSLVLTVASSVLSGIILEFIKKIIFKSNEKSECLHIDIEKSVILVDKNTIKIDDGSIISKSIKIDDNPVNKYLSLDSMDDKPNKENFHLDINNYINLLIDKIEIKPDDYEANVYTLLNVLVEENLLSKYSTYNEKAIRTLGKDCKRLVGNLINLQA